MRWRVSSETSSREEADADPARDGRAIAAAPPGKREPTTMSASPASERRDDCGELLRVVLPVAVDADGEVEAVLERVAEAGLHGAADAEVERQAGARARRRPRDAPRSVRASRRRHDDLERRVEGADLVDDAARSYPPRCRRGRWRCRAAQPRPPPRSREAEQRRAAGARGARTCARRGALAGTRDRAPPPAPDRRAARGTRPIASLCARRRRAARCRARTSARFPRRDSRRSPLPPQRARTAGTSKTRRRSRASAA